MGGAYWYIDNMRHPKPACTLEARLCSDGSYVTRSGPSCEFAACPGGTATTTGTSTGVLPYDSGIYGTVTMGPTCPVEHIPPDQNCADKPYQTIVSVFSANDPVHAIAFTDSNASGDFSFSLPQGEYVLGAGQSSLPRCNHPQVTVKPHSFISAPISCDTGIR